MNGKRLVILTISAIALAIPSLVLIVSPAMAQGHQMGMPFPFPVPPTLAEGANRFTLVEATPREDDGKVTFRQCDTDGPIGTVMLTVTPNALAREKPTFTTIDFPGANLTIASGINPRGDIVGHYISTGVTHGFLLRKGECDEDE
jgi:hypothetical protein